MMSQSETVAHGIAGLSFTAARSFKVLAPTHVASGDEVTATDGYPGFSNAKTLTFVATAHSTDRETAGEVDIAIEHSSNGGDSWSTLTTLEFDNPPSPPGPQPPQTYEPESWDDMIRVSWTVSGDVEWDVQVTCHATASISVADLP